MDGCLLIPAKAGKPYGEVTRHDPLFACCNSLTRQFWTGRPVISYLNCKLKEYHSTKIPQIRDKNNLQQNRLPPYFRMHISLSTNCIHKHSATSQMETCFWLIPATLLRMCFGIVTHGNYSIYEEYWKQVSLICSILVSLMFISSEFHHFRKR